MEMVVVPVLFGVLGEALVFYFDQFAVKKNLDWRLIAALIAGLVFAVGFNQDLFAPAGFVSPLPLLGSVLTGIVYSRVANLVHNGIEGLRRPDVTIEVPAASLPAATQARLSE